MSRTLRSLGAAGVLALGAVTGRHFLLRRINTRVVRVER